MRGPKLLLAHRQLEIEFARELALHGDELAAWIATLRQPVRVDPARVIVVRVGEHLIEKLVRQKIGDRRNKVAWIECGDPDGKRRKRNRETSIVILSWKTSSVAFVFGSPEVRRDPAQSLTRVPKIWITALWRSPDRDDVDDRVVVVMNVVDEVLRLLHQESAKRRERSCDERWFRCPDCSRAG
jgi:hypothetical protein